MANKATAHISEIPQDPHFQRRFWVVERVAWVGFILVIIAAIAGTFGSGGPLAMSRAQVGAGTLTYPAFARWQAATELNIRLEGGPGPASVGFSPDFSRMFKIDDVRPQPAEVAAGVDEIVYRFATGAGPVDIHLSLTPLHPGPVSYRVSLGGERSPSISTFVWP